MGFTWAIAGFGWVARDHMMPGLVEAGHRFVAACDPSPVARRRAAAAGAEAYDDVTLMLRETRPDALYAATPNHLHLAPVRAAAAAGVPVLCEKPMAASLDDAEAIAAHAEGGLLYGTAFDQRHHPAHVALRDALAGGAVGRITAIRIVYACWLGPDWSPPGDGGCHANWRADPAAAGGGAVMDLAPHGLDLVMFLTGEPIATLHIALQRRVHDYPVDDGGLLTARTASGVLVTQHVAYNMPDALPRRRLEIVGTEGMITATDTMGQTAGGRLLLRRAAVDDAGVDLPFDRARSPFAAQADAFAAAVGGAPHAFSAARDLALHRLFTTAYDAARAWL